jgi:hypothetical protein
MSDSTSLKAQRTTALRNSPFYYALFGWPTLLLAGPSALYLQREMTVLVSALLLGLAAWSASTTPRSGRVLLSLGVAITPMTIYFMGGVNPQAPEIAAAAGVWISGWALLQSHFRFDSGTIARLGVSACALAMSRPLSVAWLVVISVSLLLGFSRSAHWLMFRENISAKFWFGTVFVACLAQTIWVAFMGTLTQSESIGTQVDLGVHMSAADAIVHSFSHEFSWSVQIVGLFGWLDAISWWPVYIVWFVTVTCLVMTALRLGSTRERWALVLVTVGSLAIPVTAEVATHEQLGFAWQGRYILPIGMGVILISGMIVSRRFRSITDGLSWDRVARVMIVPLVGAAHFFAWGSALVRYSAGASSSFPFGDYVIKWSPPGGVWTWTFVMGFSCGVFTLWLLWVTDSNAASDMPATVAPQPLQATNSSRSEAP